MIFSHNIKAANQRRAFMRSNGITIGVRVRDQEDVWGANKAVECKCNLDLGVLEGDILHYKHGGESSTCCGCLGRGMRGDENCNPIAIEDKGVLKHVSFGVL